MKKSVLSLFILLIFIGLTLIYSGIVLADDDEEKGGSSKSSGSGSSESSSNDKSDDGNNEESDDSNKGEIKEDSDDKDKDDENEKREIIIDENGKEVEVITKTEIEDGKTETEEKRSFIDENGNKVVIVTKTEVEDGENKTTVKRKITTPDGTEITFKTKTEVEDGETKTKNSIEFNGVDMTTKLSVTTKTEGDQTKFKAELSTGAQQEIVSPNEALLTALNEIGTTNGLVFELKENVDGNTREAVFSAKAINPGKLFGIFNVNVPLETLIDAEGNVINTQKPWWAVFVNELNKAEVCHIPPGNPNNRQSITIGIPAVKAHLSHGDSVGECVAVCGDGLITEGQETCESGDTQACTTIEGYKGAETCNVTCNGFDSCTTTESCGDGIINGLEQCDDSNTISGDGCNNLCKTETVETPINNVTS